MTKSSIYIILAFLFYSVADATFDLHLQYKHKIEPTNLINLPIFDTTLIESKYFPLTVSKKSVKRALEFEIPMRVLIDEQSIKKINWVIESEQGFIISSHDKNHHHQTFTPKLLITVKTDGKDSYIYLNGKKQKQETIFIKPRAGQALYKGNSYKGAFALLLIDKVLMLVNHLDLEDYVASVLPHESWPSWSDEFNKALCIVVRTYGIFKLLEERQIRQKRGIILPYDIRATNLHQTYKGMKENEKFTRIAQETKGVILSHKNKPILAMFDACCGGVIPSKIKSTIDFAKAPYLLRTYPCYYCQECKSYTWQATYSALEVENTLKKEFKNLVRIRDLKISSADDAGLVESIKLRIPATHDITGKRFKALFKKLKSRCFSFEKQGQKYIFSGSGLGHHIGLCQWGANTLINQGWNYKEVLKFYYPGVEFMKLKPNQKIG